MAMGRLKSGEVSNLAYRKVVSEDLEPLRFLYEQSFPIGYGKKFYQSLVDPTVTTAPWAVGPVFTMAAVETCSAGASTAGVSTSCPASVITAEVIGESHTPGAVQQTSHVALSTEMDGSVSRSLSAKPHSTSLAPMAAASKGFKIPPMVNPGPVDLASYRTRDGTVAGAIAAQHMLGASCLQHDKGLVPRQDEKGVTLLYILTLAVLPQFQRRGIATRLLQHCLANGRASAGCAGVYLHVIEYNNAAVRFYKRCGFVFIRQIPDFYSIDGEKYGCCLYLYSFESSAPTEALLAPPASLTSCRRTSALSAQRVREKKKARIEQERQEEPPARVCSIL